MRLDAGYLIPNGSRRIDIKGRRRVVHVERFGGLLARVTRDGHRELSLGHVAIEPRRIVVKADQEEPDLRIVLILLVGLLDER